MFCTLETMLLLIDNYDSFTYNLAHYCAQLGADVRVYRNDAISLAQVAALHPRAIVLSPGPGTPDQAGICLPLIRRFSGQYPILGVCLGHQAIAQALGACIVRAPQVMHGKTSLIYHNQSGPFAALPDPFTATRYHSLVVDPGTVPEVLEVVAWTRSEAAPVSAVTQGQGGRKCHNDHGDHGGGDDQIQTVMALQHRTLPLVGLQFHPEAILTEHGMALLRGCLGY